MMINSIQANRISGLAPQKVSSKDSSAKSMTQPSFRALSFPSNIYSDWFVKLIKDASHLSDDSFKLFADAHLERYKATQKADRGWFSSDSVRADVLVREEDFFKLRKDIAAKARPKVVERSNIDFPAGKYTSESDYGRQSAETTMPWFLRILPSGESGAGEAQDAWDMTHYG